MNFDNSVSIYLIISPTDRFSDSAQAVFSAVREAQRLYPDWPRTMYLDIHGHVDKYGNFTDEYVEFQQEFWFSVVAPFLVAFDLPLTGALLNPEAQRNDIPDSLAVNNS